MENIHQRAREYTKWKDNEIYTAVFTIFQIVVMPLKNLYNVNIEKKTNKPKQVREERDGHYSQTWKGVLVQASGLSVSMEICVLQSI